MYDEQARAQHHGGASFFGCRAGALEMQELENPRVAGHLKRNTFRPGGPAASVLFRGRVRLRG